MARIGQPGGRSPRVNVTYDAEVGGRAEKREIPFVFGVIAEFSGNSRRKTKLRNREFLDVDSANFDSVMRRVRPRLEYAVEDKLSGDGGTKLAVQLEFSSLGDFEPEQVAAQIEPLRRLVEVRNRLNELRSKIQHSQELSDRLSTVIEQASNQIAPVDPELGAEDGAVVE